MQLRIYTIAGLALALFFLSACSSGAVKDEYNALAEKYDSLVKENSLLQDENRTLKAELEKAKGGINEYQSSLIKANKYAQIFDVYVDTYRWEAGLSTKYGYNGPTADNLEYLQKLYDISSETEDTELSESLNNALSLPKSNVKNRAWAEWHTKLAERLITTTAP